MANELDSQLRIYKASELSGREMRTLFSEVKIVKSDVLRMSAAVEQPLRDASAEADAIRDGAYRAGLDAAQREATTLLLRAREEYENARREAEADAVDFAFALAARVIRDEVERDPARIVTIVSDLLDQVRDRRDLVIYVCHEDREKLDGARELFQNKTGAITIHFEARDDVTRGGCIIETASGRIDGRIETQLRILRETMEGA